MTPRAKRLAALLLITALTTAVRLPFLLRGDQFFDSDEAVEGLMARHVSAGELPVFTWGQNYKGVPEVYLAAAIFKLARPGVVALKATTLAIFVAFAGCQFVLLDTLFSRRVAWLAALFLMLCPPVFVYWSLSGSAEIVVTLFAGTVLMLAAKRWTESRSSGALALASATAGFGLWVQQFIVFYIVALALAARWPLTRDPRWKLPRLFLGLATMYGVLGVIAFFTGGFDLPSGIGVHHPQKLWRLAAVFLAAWAGGRWLESLTIRERVASVAAFLIGYAPAIAFRLTNGGGPPIGRMDAHGLVSVLPLTTRAAVPMLLGFAGPTGDWLPVSKALAFLMLATGALSYAAIKRTNATRVFHIFLISTPIIVLASGSYTGVQSYRYLMPLFAALPVVYATGVTAAWRWNRWAGIALGGALLATFASQQIAWMRTLGPDMESRAILTCLNDQDVRSAYADYWLSYKLMFLADEKIIIAPLDGLDRYPAYTARVRAADRAPTIVRPPWPHPEEVPCNRVLP